MKKQLEIRIYPDGRVEANTLGITGKSCADYRELLEKMLKAKTAEIAYTDEYYMEETQAQQEVVQELKL
ncbi:DUF2997 domain-containing protein [Clostridia bacterium OttesenSCG-928-O13]|nr:DUF2997 domain-containing protein [Clostridia bacterium OttesenSCG-928-O13]